VFGTIVATTGLAPVERTFLHYLVPGDIPWDRIPFLSALTLDRNGILSHGIFLVFSLAVIVVLKSDLH
jgi:hypothetical protein